MEITELREKLHHIIDTVDDKKAEAMYTLFADEMEENNEYTDEFKVELDKTEAYYDNCGKMISAEEADQQIQALRHSKKVRENV